MSLNSLLVNTGGASCLTSHRDRCYAAALTDTGATYWCELYAAVATQSNVCVCVCVHACVCVCMRVCVTPGGHTLHDAIDVQQHIVRPAVAFLQAKVLSIPVL